MTLENDTAYLSVKNDMDDGKSHNKTKKRMGHSVKSTLSTFLGIALVALVIVALLFGFGYSALDDNVKTSQDNITENVNNAASQTPGAHTGP